VKTKILDCTIRDGGHLNGWRFEPACVRAAYDAARTSGIDYFEAGYRNPGGRAELGPFATCPDELLFEVLRPSDDCRLAVMTDAGRGGAELFADCLPELTPVRAVRVAAYPYELAKAAATVEALHGKGYEVFLNLMAASELGEAEYSFLRAWQAKEVLAAVTFADSFGSFIPKDVAAIMGRLRAQGFERVGFHAHNSLQMAFANTLRAIEEGAALVDASIYGMGRGSGNVPVEILVGYLEKSGAAGYNTVPYLDVIERWFLRLFREVGWGYSVESLLGGLANIHPYYVETLFKKKVYTLEEMWNALMLIKERCPVSFSAAKLDETLGARFYTPLTPEVAERAYRDVADELQVIPAADAAPAGDFALRGAHSGRTFLVVATGPSIVKQREEILAFVRREDAVVVGVNNLSGLYEPDYHCFVSRKRFQQYARSVSPKSLLLVPSFFGSAFVEREHAGAYRFFDLVAPAGAGREPVEGTTLSCQALNVAVAAILLSWLMGAGRICAVGMDGYADELDRNLVHFYDELNRIEEKEVANLRYETLVRELERAHGFLQARGCPFSILTPTSHRTYYRPLKKGG
jgi:4-hydroxy 2-oxovalerate aldolase